MQLKNADFLFMHFNSTREKYLALSHVLLQLFFLFYRIFVVSY